MGALFFRAAVEYGRGRRDLRSGKARRCVRCGVVNASDNTRCWNCWADLVSGERSLLSIGLTEQGPDSDTADSNPLGPQPAARSRRRLVDRLVEVVVVVLVLVVMVSVVTVKMFDASPSGFAKGAVVVVGLCALYVLYDLVWVRHQDKRFKDSRFIRASSWTVRRSRRASVDSTGGARRPDPFQPLIVPDLAVTIDHVVALEEYSRTELGAAHRASPELRTGWEAIDARVVAALPSSRDVDHQHVRGLSKLVAAAHRDPLDLVLAGVLLPTSGFEGVLADEGLATFGADRGTFERVGLVGLLGNLGQ